MSFDYDKLRDKEEEANWWTSYSDLWSMLAIVFLMMFVGVSMRTGTQGIQQQLEYEALSRKNAELEEQLKVYGNLRDETLQKSDPQEQEVYKKLMSKLDLLQDEAKNEKESLRKQAQENEDKEFALNQYQQIIRNIINSNMLSKSQIQRRDLVISEKKQTIAEKQQEIEELDQQVKKRESQIQQNESKIKEIDSKLAQQIKKMEHEQKQAKLSKAAMASAVVKLKRESEEKVKRLQSQNDQVREQMQAELEQSKQLEAQLSGLATKVKETEGKLSSAKAEQSKLEARTRELAQEKNALGSELQKAQEVINAKKNLISQLQKNFAGAGIKAKVDSGTGDVTIDFGEEYFDTGSSELKSGMVATLNKLIPAYSKSLFQDPKTAAKISNVEIVGFASSTFKGKYVNPSSLNPANQEAINYNLRLSFSRANAIFKHIFNPAKLSYENQKRLLPMVKVVGRGFLPDGVKDKDLPEDMPEKVFCEKYNCKKSQRVIVKFNLKE